MNKIVIFGEMIQHVILHQNSRRLSEIIQTLNEFKFTSFLYFLLILIFQYNEAKESFPDLISKFELGWPLNCIDLPY